MKSYKNNILSVLLLTFAFFILHDFFVEEIQVTKLSSIYENEKNIDIKKEIKIKAHESIHSIYKSDLEHHSNLQGKLSDLKPLNTFFSITSNISLVPQRPPSA
jgi:hypothetical protein